MARDLAVDGAMSWFDVDTSTLSVNDGVKLLQKMIHSMADDDLSEMRPAEKGRNLAYLAKVIDEVARLVQFSKGHADSRPDIGLEAFLDALTDKQYETWESWIAEARAEGRLVDPKTVQ